MLRARTTSAILLGGVVGLAVLLSGLDPLAADIKYDWLTAKAALTGDAYAPLADLAQEFGVTIAEFLPDGVDSGPHPRTPGALLLSLPLVVVPFDWLFALASAVTVACIAYLVGPTIHALEKWWRRLAVGFAIVTIPTLATIRFGAQSAVVAVLALVGWLLASNHRFKLGGGLLGVAVTLKVFPVLLVLPLLQQRRLKALGSVMLTLALLNLAGLALPGVSATRAVEAFGEASRIWVDMPGNASLVTPFVQAGLSRTAAFTVAAIVACTLVVLLMTRFRQRSSLDPLPWLVIGLLVIPISWTHYDVILLPAVLTLLMSPHRQVLRYTAPAMWFGISIALFFDDFATGPWLLASRIFMLLAWAMALLHVAGDHAGMAWEPVSSRARPLGIREGLRHV